MRWDLEMENERYKAREQGLEEGRAEGSAEGEARLASLIMKLTPGTDEYQTAFTGSKEYRRLLYEKYGV